MSLRSAACIAAALALPTLATSATSDAAGAIIGKRIDIGTFVIDATEVTIGQFARFAERRRMTTAAERDGGGFEYGAGWERRPGWAYKTPYGKPAADDEPAVHLSWHEAKTYCEDAGGGLPTQAQWRAAAYTETRASPPAPFVSKRTYPYPTGDTPGGANVTGAADGWERHAPAGRTRPGVNGLYDMGANVWEWLADANGSDRLTAGGSWWYDTAKMKANGMQFKPADFYAVYVGFRCVYTK
jgi:formylglycine-generating enzyme required for sulfatase activity